MTTWAIAAVEDEPEALLESWAAYEVQLPDSLEPSMHLAGFVVRDGGRATSAVQAIDAATWCVRTQSGRVYKLRGRPGLNLDAEYTWNAWVRIQRAEVLRDVTLELRGRLEVANHARSEVPSRETSHRLAALGGQAPDVDLAPRRRGPRK